MSDVPYERTARQATSGVSGWNALVACSGTKLWYELGGFGSRLFVFVRGAVALRASGMKYLRSLLHSSEATRGDRKHEARECLLPSRLPCAQRNAVGRRDIPDKLTFCVTWLLLNFLGQDDTVKNTILIFHATEWCIRAR